ncbi:MAG: non-homologous end-joining DNA ligase [Bacilli bacterium]
MKEKDKYAKKSLGITKFKTSIKSGKTIDEINDINIDITSPNKVIYPKDKITKLDIINYYNKIKDRVFPFLENRLISVVRAPDNINKETFYMKHLNSKNNNLGIKKIKGKNYFYFKNGNGLLNEVNMNSYEFHIWLSQKNNINHPDLLIFDLDPDDKINNNILIKVTLDLKKILDKLKLKSYIKTSGGKGYHIFVLLKTSSWSKTEKIAYDIANILYNQNPDIVTLNMSKKKRTGKIFIDYYRNKKGATCVMPYSLRLKNGAAVSCPINWNEIHKIKPSDITIKNIDKRLKKPCPWKDFFN